MVKQTYTQTDTQTDRQTDTQTKFFMNKRKKQIISHSASGKYYVYDIALFVLKGIYVSYLCKYMHILRNLIN